MGWVYPPLLPNNNFKNFICKIRHYFLIKRSFDLLLLILLIMYKFPQFKRFLKQTMPSHLHQSHSNVILRDVDKRYELVFSLKRHSKKHTGEKPHKCTFAGCNSQFAETTALKRHYRIHTGEKPYKCRYRSCGKAFADATNVKRHEMTHTGEKPFQCSYVGCGRCFSRRSSLKVHLTSLHNITRTHPLFTASLGEEKWSVLYSLYISSENIVH